MRRRVGEPTRLGPLEAVEEPASRSAEPLEQDIQRYGIVVGLVCLTVLQVGGSHNSTPIQQVVGALQPQRFKI